MTKYRVTVVEVDKDDNETIIGHFNKDPFWTGLEIVHVPWKHGKYVTLSKHVNNYSPTYVICHLSRISDHLSAQDLNKFHDKNPDEEIKVWAP